jgi:predicted nucleic acid-binding protein
MILLDTDVMIDLLRRYPPAVAWLESLGDEEILLPGFVVTELLQGCRNKAEQEKLAKEFQPYAVTWPAPEACNEALAVFASAYLSHGLGMLDALIGQATIALHIPLHTFNDKHYAAVPRLQTVQPYTKQVSWREQCVSPLRELITLQR